MDDKNNGSQSGMKRRFEARKAIQDVFEHRRDAIRDSSMDAVIKRRFLSEMNSIARDFEHKALSLADRKEGVESVVKEAEKTLENFKKDFIKSIGGDDPILRLPNEKDIRIIENI